MNKIAKALTNYIIRKGIIYKTEQTIYEYGFTITIEAGLFILFCIFIILHLHMFIEGILFFITFAPLRTYAGGLHLEKYHSCFVLSCLTFCGILLTVMYVHIPIYFLLIAVFLLEISVYILYPVENKNRKVNKKEDLYFKCKLKKFFLLDTFIVIICTIFKKNEYVLTITTTFFIVVITMILGKYKNKRVCETFSVK